MSCSIERPGLKFSQKSLLNDQYHLVSAEVDRTVIFIYFSLLSLLNVLVWIFGKILYQKSSIILFSNFRFLERPGLVSNRDLRVDKTHACVAKLFESNIYRGKNVVLFAFNLSPSWPGHQGLR